MLHSGAFLPYPQTSDLAEKVTNAPVYYGRGSMTMKKSFMKFSTGFTTSP
jgi:hypothetical protein